MTDTARAALSKFAESNDEAAFRCVVEELGGLVLSAAARRTDDRELAEEVAQNVFAIMARKASAVARHRSLAGWVYTTTRLESAKALRGRQRHRRKLDALTAEIQMESNMRDNQSEGWRDALPYLERGLDRLGERDRELLLARFFEGKSYMQIALDADGTEASCKMRVRRSLDRLKQWMAQRGVTLSVATVATGLSVAWAKSASSAVAAGLTARAMAAAPELGTGTVLANTLFTISSAKSAGLAAAVVLAFGAVTLTLQHSEARNLEGEIAQLRHQLPQQTTTAQPALLEKRTPARRVLENAALPDDPGEIAEELMLATMEQDFATIIRMMVAINRLAPDQIDALLPQIATSNATQEAKRAATRMLISFLDPDDANTGQVLDAAMEFEKSISGLYQKASRWAERDPEAALAWYRERRDDGRFSEAPKGIREDWVNSHLLSILLPAVAKGKPEAAVELLGEITDRNLVHTRGAVAGAILGRGTATDLELSREVLMSAGPQRRFGTFQMALRADMNALSLDELVVFGDSLEIDSKDRTAMLAHIAAGKSDLPIAERGDWLARQLEFRDPVWMSHFIGFGSGWKQETLSWVDSLPDGLIRDQAQHGLVLKLSNTGRRHMATEAVERARLIVDDAIRAKTLRLVVERFPDAARKAPSAATNQEAEEFNQALAESGQ